MCPCGGTGCPGKAAKSPGHGCNWKCATVHGQESPRLVQNPGCIPAMSSWGEQDWPQRTWFMDTDIWMSQKFHVLWNVALLLSSKKPFGNVKPILGRWKCKSRQWGISSQVCCREIASPSRDLCIVTPILLDWNSRIHWQKSGECHVSGHRSVICRQESWLHGAFSPLFRGIYARMSQNRRSTFGLPLKWRPRWTSQLPSTRWC